MKKTIWTFVSCLVTILTWAQQDTLSRSVTVEREIQPIIQSTGKQNITPKQLTIQEPEVNISYSDFIIMDSNAYNAQPIRFPSRPFPKQDNPNGLLEGGIGHVNSALNFRYRVPVSGTASKGIKLNLFAHHNADWGIKTWEESKIGMDFAKQWNNNEYYFDLTGFNNFFTRYGRYFAGDNSLSINQFRELKPDDKQTIWTTAINVGVRSLKETQVGYKVQTGYEAYILPSQVIEHKIRTLAKVEWNSDEHHAGMDVEIQNMIYSAQENLWVDDDTIRVVHPRHAIRLKPSYRYTGDRVRAKVGINLYLNIGKGQMMSSNEQISFAPSPDVEVEYRIIPSWLVVYGGAEGKFGYGTLKEYMNGCPYRYVARGVTSQHVSGYVPVDAFVGFKIRAAKTLLIDVYARYAYQKNQTSFYVDSTSMYNGYIHYFYGDFQHWKVGAELTYHYQDIIHILISGNYYHWTPKYYETEFIDEWPEHHQHVKTNPQTVYDRPSWDAHLRIDARIDKHWSLYSDNLFAGQSNALTQWGIQKNKAKIELNIGARYDFNKDLGIYLQLNNLLNRHHDIYYTYQSQGIHGQVGVSWKF